MPLTTLAEAFYVNVMHLFLLVFRTTDKYAISFNKILCSKFFGFEMCVYLRWVV